jgi:hypothetical protein
MSQQFPIPRGLQIPAELTLLILETATEMAKQAHKAYRIEHRARRGATLRPGKDTPLWNELRAQLRPHLRRYGDQVNLGRVLALPRQRINAFVTQGTQMPDAERTLQMLAWLIATRRGQRPG